MTQLCLPRVLKLWEDSPKAWSHTSSTCRRAFLGLEDLSSCCLRPPSCFLPQASMIDNTGCFSNTIKESSCYTLTSRTQPTVPPLKREAKPRVVSHTYNTAAQEAETARSQPSSRPTWASNKSLSKKKRKEKGERRKEEEGEKEKRRGRRKEERERGRERR